MTEIAQPIKLISQEAALQKTLKEIQDTRQGRINVLKTRWNSLNRLMMGGLRFRQNVVIAGISGHGKSWFLQLLENDLLDQSLNGDFPSPVLIIHFGFEMPVEDECIRLLTASTSIPHSEIISAYSRLGEEKWEQLQAKARELKDQKIFRSVRSGSRLEIVETIRTMQEKFPNHKIIFTIDHSLLVQPSDEGSEVELLAGIAKMLIKVKQDYGTLGIVLGQLTQELISPSRRLNPSLHFPTQGDIHGSKQIIHAVDWMFALNSPEHYLPKNIQTYGTTAYSYRNRLFLHVLKGRFAEETGLIVLDKDLKHGNLIEVDTKNSNPQTNGTPYH